MDIKVGDLVKRNKELVYKEGFDYKDAYIYIADFILCEVVAVDKVKESLIVHSSRSEKQSIVWAGNFQKVTLSPILEEKVKIILNKYLPTRDMLNCQDELIEAGLEQYAEID